MTLRSFAPGLAVDKVTGKGVPVMTAKVLNLDTGDPVDVFDPEDTVNPRSLTTNQAGYFAAFKADADRLSLTFGGVTLFVEALELYPTLKADAETAAAAAQTAAADTLAGAQSSIDASVASANTAASNAASSATSAQNAANLVGAPAKDAMDAALGGDVAGLVPIVAGKVSSASRTTHAPALGLYFPEAEGAVGNGVADDTVALQAALNAAASAKKTLSLDAKTYKITSTLLFPSQVRIIGQNAGGQISGGTKILWAGAAGGTVMGPANRAGNTVNLVLEGVWLNGGTTAAVVLDLYRTSYADIRAVYIDDARNSDGVGILLDGNVAGQCYFNVFTGCKVSGGACGVRFQNGANANQWIGGKLGNGVNGFEFLSNSAGNALLGADLETNTGKHIYVDATSNKFVGVHMEDAPIGYHLTVNGWNTPRIGTSFASTVTTPVQDDSKDGGAALDRLTTDTVGLRLGATKVQSAYLSTGTTVNADPYTYSGSAASTINMFRNVSTTGGRSLVIYKGDGTSTPAFKVDAGLQNVHLADADAAGGQRVIAIRNYSTAPTATPSAGGVLYADGGALRFNTSSGAKVTVAGDVFTLAASTTIGATVRYALVNGGSSGVTITLGAATKGIVQTIKKIDAAAGVVTIATTSSQTIDGATTKVLSAQYNSVTVVSDGLNWYTV